MVAIAVNKKSALLGAFKFYVVRHLQEFAIRRLVERKADWTRLRFCLYCAIHCSDAHLNQPASFCVYGAPSLELAIVPEGAVQVSPLYPGAPALEDLTQGTLQGAVVAAPPGTAERRYVLALALRALAPGAPLTAMAPKDKGGARLATELKAFGCAVVEFGRRHQRICRVVRPVAPQGLEAAISAGAPRLLEAMGQWSQPGVFSWDRRDPGTQHLIAALPPLSGRGADLGCGIGLLAVPVLANSGIIRLDLVDIDRRAIEAARRNISDPRAFFHWCDARIAPPLEGLDFVVMNAPFHDGGGEDKALGQAFIRRSHQVLRRGGTAWLVANRHLPYESVLNHLFARVALNGESGGFKIYEAQA